MDVLSGVTRKMAPGVDIIVVNWNSGDQLRAALRSIAESDKDRFRVERVVIVDNASTDGSIEGIEIPGLRIQVIRNSVNRGFAAACNQGAKGSGADYLLFLNPDVELFRESLREPLSIMESPGYERVGIAGVQLVDQRGLVHRSCSRFPTPRGLIMRAIGLHRVSRGLIGSIPMAEWDHGNTCTVDQVMGAFYLTRRKLFELLGGFDERFFVYFEEVDYAYRALHAGWTSLYVAGAKAYHRERGSSDAVKAMRLFYSLRSRILYSYKHFGWPAATGVLAATVLIEPLNRIVLSLGQLSVRGVGETIAAYCMLLGDLPASLKYCRTD